jgi:hypothetical protein
MTHIQVIGNSGYNNENIEMILQENADSNILAAINIILDKIPSFKNIWFIGFMEDSYNKTLNILCEKVDIELTSMNSRQIIKYDFLIDELKLACIKVGIKFEEKYKTWDDTLSPLDMSDKSIVYVYNRDYFGLETHKDVTEDTYLIAINTILTDFPGGLNKRYLDNFTVYKKEGDNYYCDNKKYTMTHFTVRDLINALEKKI